MHGTLMDVTENELKLLFLLFFAHLLTFADTAAPANLIDICSNTHANDCQHLLNRSRKGRLLFLSVCTHQLICTVVYSLFRT